MKQERIRREEGQGIEEEQGKEEQGREEQSREEKKSKEARKRLGTCAEEEGRKSD